MLFTLILSWVFLLCGVAAQYIKQAANETVTFDNTCNDAQKSVVIRALEDAFEMAAAVSSDPMGGVDDGPAFVDLFGPSAMGKKSFILPTFHKFVYSQWKISASCDLTDSSPLCADQTSHGVIASEWGEYASSSPRLVFCNEFWGLSPLSIQVRKGHNHQYSLAARFDLGYLRENHGELPFHACLIANVLTWAR